MSTSLKIAIVFGGILLIWLLSFAIHLFESQERFKVEDFDFKNVKSISISDRGIKGNGNVVITDKDSVNKALNLLRKSTLVDFESVNLKASLGLCDIELVHLNKKDDESFSIVKTSFSGAIIQSGDYYYRNDSLLMSFERLLK